MNPFHRHKKPFKAEGPSTYFGHVDSIELDDEGVASVKFDAVGAAWFDRVGRRLSEARSLGWLDEAPLALLELKVDTDRLRTPFDEGSWWKVSVTDNELESTIQESLSLYAAGTRRFLSDAQPVEGELAVALTKAFSLDDVEDATEEQIRIALGSPRVDHVLIYDVGQGSASAISELSNSTPALYYDLGGGVGSNSRTFPTRLKQFCWTKNPPIVLSHWDWDHWSSGNRDARSKKQTWIVPRQTLGAVHRSFAAGIQRHGRLLVWPNGLKSVVRGCVSIEKCTGAGKNNSGLAMIVTGPNGDKVLLPGDARYTAIPSLTPRPTSQFVSIVAPHHGGTSGGAYAPTCPALAHSRLVYSCGNGNTYGHPATRTIANHQGAGWNHRGRGHGAVVERRTSDRGTAGLGHVALGFNVIRTPPNLGCTGANCQLEATQS